MKPRTLTLLKLPDEILTQITEYFTNKDELEMLPLCKSWSKQRIAHIWREPGWQITNKPPVELYHLLVKYGANIKTLLLSEDLGEIKSKMLLRKCRRLHNLSFYGEAEAWLSLEKLLPARSLKSLEISFTEKFTEVNIKSLNGFERLTSLSISHNGGAFINNILKSLPKGQLRDLTLLEMKVLDGETFDLIQRRFTKLQTFVVQTLGIDNKALELLSQPMLRLKRFEVDINGFKKDQPCFSLEAKNFPRLRQLLIDLHGTKSSKLNCKVSGIWRRLHELSLFRLNTEDPDLISGNSFPRLRSLQAQVYQPFNQKTVANLVTEFPRLSNIQINKVEMTDEDFRLPATLICRYRSSIKNFAISNNTSPLSRNYLAFLMRYLTSMTEWTVPTLDCEPVPKENAEGEEGKKDEEKKEGGEGEEDEEEEEETEVEQFVKFLLEHEFDNLMPSLTRILVDASPSSVPLVHFMAQCCPKLSYMFINLLDNSIEAKELKEEFSRINPSLEIEVD